MKIILSKSLNHNNHEIKELDLNLENLTGQDLIDAEENLRRAGINISGAADFSRTFLIAVAAKSLKLPRELLYSLSASDFTKIVNEVLIFLAGQGLDSQTQNQA